MLSYIYNLATDKHKGFVAGLVKYFLYLLSPIYGLAVRALIFIYRLKPYRLNCKVISVGNITLGGTGKTSLALLIARCLKEKGHKVAILSRGYKRVGSRFSVFGSRPNTEHRTPNTETMGDEPYMLKMNLKDVPVLVDTDRIRIAKLAIRDYGVDTVILDDGFQQWRIKKDMEIVTIDATRPFGNRNLIPRGILREPLSSLKRADVFILTKTNLNPDNQAIKDFLNSINPRSLIVESVHSPVFFYGVGKYKTFLTTETSQGMSFDPLTQSVKGEVSCEINKANELLNINIFQGKTVTLFSGIGDPDSFENLIKSLRMKVGLSFRFPDHYSYVQKDLENIIRESQKKNINTIVTTEKDAVRINNLPPIGHDLRLLYLRIELRIIKNEQEFYNRLLGLYSY